MLHMPLIHAYRTSELQMNHHHAADGAAPAIMTGRRQQRRAGIKASDAVMHVLSDADSPAKRIV